MKRALFVVLGLVVLGIAGVVPAMAAALTVTSSTVIPMSGTTFVPCANGLSVAVDSRATGSASPAIKKFLRDVSCFISFPQLEFF